MGCIVAMVGIEARFNQEVDIAREAHIALKTSAQSEGAMLAIGGIGAAVEAHASHTVDPEAAVGVDAAKGIVEVEQIIETCPHSPHSSVIILHEGSGIEVDL